MNKKILVTYFSATNTTKDVALELAKIIQADLFEITPEIPYTAKDLNWLDKNSRSSKEMNDKSSRPKIKNKLNNINDYDLILLGFPIWWYIAPTIINTFLESYDFSNKIIIPFATSGGSGFGNTIANLKTSTSNYTTWVDGKILNGKIDKAIVNSWLNKYL